MAYVGISRELVNRVHNNISVMEQKEVTALGVEPKVILLAEHPEVTRMLWGEYVNLKDAIPPEWKNVTDSIYTKCSVSNGSETLVTYNFTIHLEGAAECPPDYSRYSSKVLSADQNHPDFKDIVKYAGQRMEIAHRWRNAKNKVTHFLENCKSLNEAVKTWPDIALYVDKGDLVRLEAKREKAEKSSAAKEALASMNVDELVGAVVIARMSGAA